MIQKNLFTFHYFMISGPCRMPHTHSAVVKKIVTAAKSFA